MKCAESLRPDDACHEPEDGQRHDFDDPVQDDDHRLQPDVDEIGHAANGLRRPATQGERD